MAKQPQADMRRGKLKIYFGYASNPEKTIAMLKAAHMASRNGTTVFVGSIDANNHSEASSLLAGLPCIPPLTGDYNGTVLSEFNLDKALAAAPDLILIDGLAHNNAPVARHVKRYQDIEELLRAGIDVYTTANVEEIESLNDVVTQITGTPVIERIPDHIFDHADQVELIDTDPMEMIATKQVENESTSAANLEKLTALKELALRRYADRIASLAKMARADSTVINLAEEHILVCLSSSPTNPRNIRAAARMASAFHGIFTAVFVETSDYPLMSRADKQRLADNIRLAKQLGAKTETLYGDDIAYQLAEFARKFGVSKIVLGRSAAKRHPFFSKPTFSDVLTRLVPNLDIYIIPDSTADTDYRQKTRPFQMQFHPKDSLISLFVLILTTGVCGLFEVLNFDKGNMIAPYILCVLIISVMTSHRLYGVIASVLSVLIFNFFFTAPKYTFWAVDKEYIITLSVMFITSLLAGSLAARLKKNAEQSARVSFRTKVHLDTIYLLGRAESREEIFDVTAKQLVYLLNRSVIMYPAQENALTGAKLYPNMSGADISSYLTEKEKTVADWVYLNNKQAGSGTNTFADSECLYFAVRTPKNIFGVVGIVTNNNLLDGYERSIVISILDECALSLESIKNAEEKKEAALLAQNEQLRANLLRSISHDLRTPLTSISGNASNLLANGSSLDEAIRRQIYSDIYDDAMWLITLVENLLAITRFEGGSVKLHETSELVCDVIDEAMKHVSRDKTLHNIIVKPDNDYLMARMDTRLIIQVIVNLVNNAIKYTPEHSDIVIDTYERDSMIHIRISDNGNGIPDGQKDKVFDMFYTGAAGTDSRRGIGLGLPLCRSIVNAHNGTISLSDYQPHGAVFDFTLEKAEVTIHE